MSDYASAQLCVPVAGLQCTDMLSCDASDQSFHDQVATLEAAITFLQQLLPGRSMTRGTACNPPEMLRALSMERSKSGKMMTDGKTACCSVQIECMCVQHMAKEQHYVSSKQTLRTCKPQTCLSCHNS